MKQFLVLGVVALFVMSFVSKVFSGGEGGSARFVQLFGVSKGMAKAAVWVGAIWELAGLFYVYRGAKEANQEEFSLGMYILAAFTAAATLLFKVNPEKMDWPRFLSNVSIASSLVFIGYTTTSEELGLLQ